MLNRSGATAENFVGRVNAGGLPVRHHGGGPASGGPLTFEQAYERWYRAVVRSAWSICRDLPQAEELAQEAFVKAYRRWSRIDAGGYAEPWVHRVVMNLALDVVRRRARGRVLEATAARRHLQLVPGPQLPDGAVDALRDLPKRQREAVFLRVIADLPEEEVARLMGCSVGSVKTHKSRGLAQLRELFGEREEVSGGHGTATEAAHG